MTSTYSEALRVVGVLSFGLDDPSLLAVLVCVPLSLYGDLLPAVLGGLALVALQYWSWSPSKGEKALKNKAQAGPQQHFTVCAAEAADAPALNSLYEEDYIHAHRKMHDKPAANASSEEWQAALGPINFSDVLMSTSEEVRLLKLHSEADGCVGYILYELREKGPHGKRRQRFCELVNVVVSSNHRGCGAGRLLLDALLADVASNAPGHNGDLRLFVAERNAAPRAWYKRLGFADAGWQTECVAGSDVRFLRMMMKNEPSA